MNHQLIQFKLNIQKLTNDKLSFRLNIYYKL